MKRNTLKTNHFMIINQFPNIVKIQIYVASFFLFEGEGVLTKDQTGGDGELS